MASNAGLPASTFISLDMEAPRVGNATRARQIGKCFARPSKQSLKLDLPLASNCCTNCAQVIGCWQGTSSNIGSKLV